MKRRQEYSNTRRPQLFTSLPANITSNIAYPVENFENELDRNLEGSVPDQPDCEGFIGLRAWRIIETTMQLVPRLRNPCKGDVKEDILYINPNRLDHKQVFRVWSLQCFCLCLLFILTTSVKHLPKARCRASCTAAVHDGVWYDVRYPSVLHFLQVFSVRWFLLRWIYYYFFFV